MFGELVVLVDLMLGAFPGCTIWSLGLVLIVGAMEVYEISIFHPSSKSREKFGGERSENVYLECLNLLLVRGSSSFFYLNIILWCFRYLQSN